MNKLTVLVLSSVLFTALLSSGCTTVLVGGAATGAAVVHDRRSTGVVIDDQEIELRALKLKSDHPEITQHSNISVTSYNLVALLTGQAESQQISGQFADLVSRLPRVKKVVNEVVIGAERSFTESTSDTYLTSRAKLALFDLGIEDFDPTRIKVVTSQGTVYLMGLVTHREAEAASDKVRFISGVKRVVKVFEYIN
ncbi:MAG: BON domain-containing protein [Chromatiales bacterium]|jgi:osmotically-inducible protein OsmY